MSKAEQKPGPLTMSAEREAYYRKVLAHVDCSKMIKDGWAELDAERAARAETRERLEQAVQAITDAELAISACEALKEWGRPTEPVKHLASRVNTICRDYDSTVCTLGQIVDQRDALKEQLAQAQKGHTRAAMDVALLLSELRAHEENTDEPLEDEDAAIVAEIESRYTNAALRAKQEPPQALCGEVSEVRREYAFRDEPCDLLKGHTGSHRANGVRWMTEPPQALAKEKS